MDMGKGLYMNMKRETELVAQAMEAARQADISARRAQKIAGSIAGGGSGESYGVTPEDYGAKGDGVTDDYDAIVSAMNAAVSEKKALSFKAGRTYLIKKGWELISNLTIEGNNAIILTNEQHGTGWQKSAVRIAGANDSNWVRNVTVKELEIKASDDCPSQYMLQMLRCSDIVLSRVTLTCEKNLHDERRCCLDVFGAFENILFENCRFNQLSAVLEGGIWVREWRSGGVSKNIRFINCDFLKAGADEVFAVWGWRGIVKDVIVSGCTFEEIEDETYWTNERFRPYWYITLGQSPKQNGQMSTEVRFENNTVRSTHCETVFRMLGDGTYAVVDNCDFFIGQDPLVPEHSASQGANTMLAQGNWDAQHTIIRNCRGVFKGDSARRLTYSFGTIENCVFDLEGMGGIFSGTSIIRNNIITGRNMGGGFNDCNRIYGNRISLTDSAFQIFAGYGAVENNEIDITTTGYAVTGLPLCSNNSSWDKTIFSGNRVTWTCGDNSLLRQYQFPDTWNYVFDNRFYSNNTRWGKNAITGYVFRRNNYFNGIPEKLFPCTGVSFGENEIEVNYKKKMTALANVHPENCTDPIIYAFTGGDELLTLSGHGKYTVKQDGTATVTATCGSYEATQTIKIKLLPAPCETLSLSRKSVKTAVGRTTYIKALYTPYWTTDILVFRSSDEEVFSITQDGEITAHKLGNAKIIATCGDKTAECEVSVVDESELPVYTDGTWTLDNTVAYVPLPSVGENHTLYIEMTVDLATITAEDDYVHILGTAANGETSNKAPVMMNYLTRKGVPAYEWGTVESMNEGGKATYRSLNYVNTGMFDEENGAKITFLFKPSGVYNPGGGIVWETVESTQTIPPYSGYLSFNADVSSEDAKVQTFTSSAELKAALEAGSIHASKAKGYKITTFILYSHDTYDTKADVLKYREGADIDIRFDENGMPVNAGTSGALIWSAGNTQESGDEAAKLGAAKIGNLKLGQN